ncbi:MAG: hypothetical protein NTX97_01235 [Bacteroidetes bacterium]|nr:hypothetical protein [Bacteroidota bacterium]
MNINKNNYEAFFLDYHEGNLSPLQVADLLLFVEQHPELREEFESFENVTLDDLSTISFGDKSSLKKEININNKDEYFIRSIENILTTEEKGLVENFIKQHPQYLPEFELFQKTKLSADTSIVFENKEFLKRSLSPALSKGEGVVPELQKWNDLLIASIEGLLSKQETTLLDQQISVDAEMQHNYNLYKKTKLVADVSVVYENKEELKRKERKIIPFYYYVAAAASTLLLVGLFFIYKGKNTVDQNFADKNNRIETIQKESNGTSNEVIKNSSITPIQTAAVVTCIGNQY